MAISEFCWNINDLRVEMTVFVLVMVQIEILHNINSLTNIDTHMTTTLTPATLTHILHTMLTRHFEIMSSLESS